MRILFMLMAEVLIAMCFFLYFMEDMVWQVLPEQYAVLLLDNKPVVLAVTIVANIIAAASMISRFSKKRAQARAQQMHNHDLLKRPTADAGYQVAGHKIGKIDAAHKQDGGIVNIDRSTMNAARQVDERLTQIAANTDWSPLQSGGSNFKTHGFMLESSTRMRTKASTNYLLLGGVFLLVGLGIGGFALYNLVTKGFEFGFAFMLLFPLVFGGFGLGIMRYPRPRVFDRNIGWFWVGSPKLNHSMQLESLEKSCRLERITALQIIAERIASEDSTDYDSYELNLVLEDGSRLNVMDHGDWQSLADDARQLAEFLAVPILK